MATKFSIPDQDFVVEKPKKKQEKEIVKEEIIKEEIVEEAEPVMEEGVQNKLTEKKDPRGRKSPSAKYVPIYEDSSLREALGYTRGKPGRAVPRRNIGFSMENLEYLQRWSRRAGLSMSEYINILIDKVRAGEIDVHKYYDYDN